MNEIAPENTDFSVIIVAAGSGTRFGAERPKQYLLIRGKPVLRHTIEKFLPYTKKEHIHVVISKDHEDLYHDEVKDMGLPAPVYGGATRQESVKNALLSLSLPDDHIILIHDAARPCLDQKDLENLLETLKTARAATLVTEVVDTQRLKDGKFLGDTLDRTTLLAIQTPQGFHFGDIRKAHLDHATTNCTDDTMVAALNGIKSVYVSGSKTNIKITTPEDLFMAEHILNPYPSPTIPKTATGYDVHAFGEESTHIRIGGIDIPHTHKLLGHSDADVVLHSITDAFYGLVANGDIGAHFPPNNPDHKGKDSSVFLLHAYGLIGQARAILTHIDVTIICEAPKIGPHRESIRQRISGLLSIPLSKISIKATTTEQLGFTGRKEGIAAQAIVTALFPDEDA